MTKVVRDLPPAYLLFDCQAVAVDIVVNADLTTSIDNLSTALELCNADKVTLREWAESP